MSHNDVPDIEFFSIDIEQCPWKASHSVLMGIRRQVFIDEQSVPESEEFSEEDEKAIHWIAYGANNVAMGTARLLNNQVGRMAVLKPYRKHGVGSALMRQIIRYAATSGLDSIQLDAQVHALPFYEAMKFESDGPVFEEVGIPHQHMTLALKHFLTPRITPATADISEEERSHIALNNINDFRCQASIIAQKAHRQIRILSPSLDPNIFDNDALKSNLLNFARQHPYAEIHILVQNPQLLVQNSHRLLNLYHRLPSRVQMRTLNPECQTSHTEFMITDQAGILYKQTLNRYTGYAVYWSPVNATELANDFDTLWNSSEPDPELRRMPI